MIPSLKYMSYMGGARLKPNETFSVDSDPQHLSLCQRYLSQVYIQHPLQANLINADTVCWW